MGAGVVPHSPLLYAPAAADSRKRASSYSEGRAATNADDDGSRALAAVE
jgi:hypothetical protein